jgi:3-methyladenine DNA glycosylase AlkD
MPSPAKQIAKDKPTGREVWARWDRSARIYELFASEDCDDYVGCADTKTEAQAVAKQLINEWRST